MRETLDIPDKELELWDKVSRRLKVPFHGREIISQFEGYEGLREFDWEGHREKYEGIQRLDRILESEHDTPNRFKASKQADVLMLFYLFSADELRELMDRLGYSFSPDAIPRNIDEADVSRIDPQPGSALVSAFAFRSGSFVGPL